MVTLTLVRSLYVLPSDLARSLGDHTYQILFQDDVGGLEVEVPNVPGTFMVLKVKPVSE